VRTVFGFVPQEFMSRASFESTCWLRRSGRHGGYLSASSGRPQSLQFGAAYLADDAQWINRMTVNQISQFRKRLVRCEIRLDNCSNDGLCAFDYARA
jgi:hypothetical protein